MDYKNIFMFLQRPYTVFSEHEVLHFTNFVLWKDRGLRSYAAFYRIGFPADNFEAGRMYNFVWEQD